MRTTPLHKRFTPFLAPTRIAVAAAMATALAAGHAPLAYAQTGAAAAAATPIAINIPAQPLGQALNELARQANLQLTFPAGLVAGKQAPAVVGQLTVRQALDRMLAGSGLAAAVEGSSVVVRQAPPQQSGEATLPAVTVTAGAGPLPGELPKPFAGGQVARGGQLGLLGNRDRMDTPVSSQSYTRQLLDDQQARDLPDALANDSSMVSSIPTYSSLAAIQSRGIDVPSDSFLFNGVANQFSGRNLPLVGIERVEVLRGPTALFSGVSNTFGSGAGGTVNLVPSRATDRPIADVTVGYESDSVRYGLLDVGRRFGTDDEWGVRLGAELRKGNTPARFNKDDRQVLALAIDYRGERTRAALDVNYQDNTTLGVYREFYGLAAPSLPRVPAKDFNTGQPYSRESLRFRSMLLSLEHDFAPGTTAFFKYGLVDENFDGIYTYPSNLQTNGDFKSDSYRGNGFLENRNVEGGLRSELKTGALTHKVVVAYSAGRKASAYAGSPAASGIDNLYNSVLLPEPQLGPFPASTFANTRYAFSGLTIADTMHALDDRLQVTVGVRRQAIRSTPYDGTTGVRTADPEYNEARWSPGVGVLVRPMPWLSVYGNYLEALAAGGVAPLNANNAGAALPPIVSKQGEFGAKFDFGAVGGSLAVFQIKEPRAGVDLVTNAYRETGIARYRGVEGTVFGELRTGVRVLAGLTYLEPELSESDDETLVGKGLPAIARFRGVVYGEYDVPKLSGLTLTGRLTRSGSSPADALNTRDFPSWSRLDVGARYSFVAQGYPMTARLSVENVLDKRYWVGGAYGTFYSSPARTVLLSLKASF